MNWVGGARSRIKQSHEKKIQKEFFERQKLAKKVSIHKQLSPRGQKKPVSLDLLSLQTINLTHGGENTTTQRRQPVKVMLGDRTNLLPRKQEDLELPMSPIRHPSKLTLTDTKTEKDGYKSIYPSNKSSHPESLFQVGDPNGPEALHTFVRINQVEHSIRTLPVPSNRNVFDKSLMSESVPLCHDKSYDYEPLPPKYRKKFPQDLNLEHENFQFKTRKEDLLAFQRAEKEKHMSASKPSLRQSPHQDKSVSKERHDKPSTSTEKYSEVHPTAVSAPPKVTHKLEGSAHKGTLDASNNGMSDKERKTLLGLDFEEELNCAEDKRYVPVFKKAKTTSSFEEMINNYEKPAKKKTNLNTVSEGVIRHEKWRKFTHEKGLTHVADQHQVPDTSKASEGPADDTTSLFFRHRATKKQVFPSKRPSTVLQELLCLDEDLNNSDLFLTQDFTFEERLDIDFEEPLQHRQEHNVTSTADKLPINLYVSPVEKLENKEYVYLLKSAEQPKEQLVHLHESKKQLVCLSKPKEQSSELLSNTSVGIQCNRIVNVSEMSTQTSGKATLLLNSGTQTEIVVSKSAMTDTDDLLLLPNDQPSHSPDQSNSTTRTDDHLALAQSTIVWQSLMIKLLKIDAKFNHRR